MIKEWNSERGTSTTREGLMVGEEMNVKEFNGGQNGIKEKSELSVPRGFFTKLKNLQVSQLEKGQEAAIGKDWSIGWGWCKRS